MRPLSVGEILDAAFAAFRRNFGRLCLAVLVIVIPTAIVQTLVFSSIDYDFSAGLTSTSSSSSVSEGTQAAGQLVIYVISVVNQALASAACLRIIGADIMGNKVGPSESLRYALRRLPRLTGTILLYVLALIAGVFLCLIGIVWTWVLFAMAIPAALFEDQGPVNAMRRSRDLVTGFWWRTFGTLFVMSVVVTIVQSLFTFTVVGGLLLDSDNDLLGWVIFTLASIVGYTVALPLQAATNAYIYFDLRVRKEGFDLQLMADRIETAPLGGVPEVQGLPPREAPPASGGFLPPRPPGG